MLRDFFDGLGDVAEVVGAVGAEVSWICSRVRMGWWTTGPSPAMNSKSRPMGVKGRQEVGEDDGGVDAEALGGGDGDFGGDAGGAADVEEGVVLADGHVLGHVAAGLAEEPDGRAVDGVAEAGADEAAGAFGVGGC